MQTEPSKRRPANQKVDELGDKAAIKVFSLESAPCLIWLACSTQKFLECVLTRRRDFSVGRTVFGRPLLNPDLQNDSAFGA